MTMVCRLRKKLSKSVMGRIESKFPVIQGSKNNKSIIQTDRRRDGNTLGYYLHPCIQLNLEETPKHVF